MFIRTASSFFTAIFMIIFGLIFVSAGISVEVSAISSNGDILLYLFPIPFILAGSFVIFLGVKELIAVKRMNSTAHTDHAPGNFQGQDNYDDAGRTAYPDDDYLLSSPLNGDIIPLFIGIMFVVVGSIGTIIFTSSGAGAVGLAPLIFVIVGAVLLVATIPKISKSKKAKSEHGNDQYSAARMMEKREAERIAATRYYENNVFRDNTNANGMYDSSVPDNYADTRRSSKKKKNDTGVYSYMNCPHCGSLNEVGNKECRNCGKKL